MITFKGYKLATSPGPSLLSLATLPSTGPFSWTSTQAPYDYYVTQNDPVEEASFMRSWMPSSGPTSTDNWKYSRPAGKDATFNRRIGVHWGNERPLPAQSSDFGWDVRVVNHLITKPPDNGAPIPGYNPGTHEFFVIGTERRLAAFPAGRYFPSGGPQRIYPINWIDALPAWAIPRSIDYVYTVLGSGSAIAAYFASDQRSGLESFVQDADDGCLNEMAFITNSRLNSAVAPGGTDFNSGPMDARLSLGPHQTVLYRASDQTFWANPGTPVKGINNFTGSWQTWFYTGTTKRIVCGAVTTTAAGQTCTVEVYYMSLGLGLTVSKVTLTPTMTLLGSRSFSGTTYYIWEYDTNFDPRPHVPAGCIPIDVRILEPSAVSSYRYEDNLLYPGFTFMHPIVPQEGGIFVPGKKLAITA